MHKAVQWPLLSNSWTCSSPQKEALYPLSSHSFCLFFFEVLNSTNLDLLNCSFIIFNFFFFLNVFVRYSGRFSWLYFLALLLKNIIFNFSNNISIPKIFFVSFKKYSTVLLFYYINNLKHFFLFLKTPLFPPGLIFLLVLFIFFHAAGFSHFLKDPWFSIHT